MILAYVVASGATSDGLVQKIVVGMLSSLVSLVSLNLDAWS